MGPSATQMLGDYGAEVIKVERPRDGDLSRSSITDPAGRDNPVFYSINRNKRSITVDTRTDEGKAVIYDLVRDADVVVSNFRAGVMDRIGFGYDTLRAINPRIIWASGTGFGEAGPYAHKGGQDVLLQALSGVMWRARARTPRSRSIRRRSATTPRACTSAGHPAGAAGARAHGCGPARRRAHVRLDAAHADAGGRHPAQPRHGGELGGHAL